MRNNTIEKATNKSMIMTQYEQLSFRKCHGKTKIKNFLLGASQVKIFKQDLQAPSNKLHSFFCFPDVSYVTRTLSFINHA